MSYSKQAIVRSALIGLALSTVSTFSLAQEAARPDLSGIWTNSSRTGLTRPRGLDTLVVSGERAQEIVANMSIAGISPESVAAGPAIDPETGAPPAGGQDFGLRGYNLFWTDPGSSLALVKGEFRTSYIVNPENGQVPRLENPKVDLNRPEFGLRYFTGAGDASGPEAMPLEERCLLGFGNTSGPGMLATLYNSSYQFVQTEDYVLINVEMVHDSRIIPIFASADEARSNRRPAVLTQWLGDSVGWYEDGTLVVETTNIKPIQMVQSSIPISPEGKFTERFSRYADNEIVYQFTVEDSNLYSQPWTAELSYYPLQGRMYEYACHEGNYAMPGILAGARRAEAEAGNN